MVLKMDGANILIVEDERILAEDLKGILLELGYKVAGSVASGDAAIDIASKNKVDLVLMDIKIEGHLDGIDTAKTLKDRFCIPVIYLTAYSDDAILRKAKKTEPFGYMIKPYRSSEIKSVIEIALFKAQIEKEHRNAYHQLEGESEKRADQLKEMNAALKILMDYREKEKKEVIQKLAKELNDRVIPYFDTIRMRWSNKDLNDLLDAVTTTLQDISQPSKSDIPETANLTPMESRVADLIRQGRTSKEIATLLGITLRGVTFHRGNIRRKLGIKNKKRNLQTSLNEIP
jgi:DNA-binding NarL/FixJ family response regulator